MRGAKAVRFCTTPPYLALGGVTRCDKYPAPCGVRCRSVRRHDRMPASDGAACQEMVHQGGSLDTIILDVDF